MPATDPDRLRRQGVWLESATMVWTAAVAAAAITAGVAASSIALIGLGLESAIEMITSAIIIWQLGGAYREARALRLIGALFLASAAYLAVKSIHDLASDTRSGHSAPGLALAAAALLVLPVLAILKRRTGLALANRALIADSAETGLTAAAAAAALVGTGLYTWLGRWQAVPAAGLAIGAVAAFEGIEILAHRH
jgi:divalent metal cation (Fe/Co/Zn/Cd) transporter